MSKPKRSERKAKPSASGPVKKHICIDFEGEGGTTRSELRLPSLLGAVLPGWSKGAKRFKYRCYLVDPQLSAMTFRGAKTLKGIRILSTLDDAIHELVCQAEEKGCKLVYYAKHEERIVRNFCTDPALIDRFHACARDVHPETREIIKTQRFGVPKGKLTLQKALDKMGVRFELQDKPGGGVGETCRALRDAGTLAKRWIDWPQKAQDLARDLLLYNLHDCLGARALVENLDWRHAKRQPRPPRT
jgi:hypothetical protein